MNDKETIIGFILQTKQRTPYTTERNTMYKITGTTRNGKRFRILTDSYMQAMCINLWSGTVWEKIDNKWKIIKRVYN